MQNELVNAFESDYSSCTSTQEAMQTSWDKHGNHTFFVFAEIVLSPQWKHEGTQIWWMLNGWGKWCLLMNNTENIIFFSGHLGKSCSQVVDKYFNACLPFGRLSVHNNCYNHCRWARGPNELYRLWGSEAVSSEANPALVCLQHFREQNHSLAPTQNNSPSSNLSQNCGVVVEWFLPPWLQCQLDFPLPNLTIQRRQGFIKTEDYILGSHFYWENIREMEGCQKKERRWLRRHLLQYITSTQAKVKHRKNLSNFPSIGTK